MAKVRADGSASQLHHGCCAQVIAFQADPRVSLEHCLARSVAAVPVTEIAQLDHEDYHRRARRAVRIAVSPRSHPFNFLFLLGARLGAGVLSIGRGLAAACSRPPAIGPGLWLHTPGLH